MHEVTYSVTNSGTSPLGMVITFRPERLDSRVAHEVRLMVAAGHNASASARVWSMYGNGPLIPAFFMSANSVCFLFRESQSIAFVGAYAE